MHTEPYMHPTAPQPSLKFGGCKWSVHSIQTKPCSKEQRHDGSIRQVVICILAGGGGGGLGVGNVFSPVKLKDIKEGWSSPEGGCLSSYDRAVLPAK